MYRTVTQLFLNSEIGRFEVRETLWIPGIGTRTVLDLGQPRVPTRGIHSGFRTSKQPISEFRKSWVTVGYMVESGIIQT